MQVLSVRVFCWPMHCKVYKLGLVDITGEQSIKLDRLASPVVSCRLKYRLHRISSLFYLCLRVRVAETPGRWEGSSTLVQGLQHKSWAPVYTALLQNQFCHNLHAFRVCNILSVLQSNAMAVKIRWKICRVTITKTVFSSCISYDGGYWQTVMVCQ